MSSRLSVHIDIIKPSTATDSEGFSVHGDEIIAYCRAEKDERHGSESQSNMSTFSTAVTRFRFRRIPGVEVTTAHTIRCCGEDYRIISILNPRVLFVEAMTEKIEPSKR